jgi:PPP family 3-phenylpropionic acid transporter
MASSPGAARRAFPAGIGWRFFLSYLVLFLPFAVATPYLQLLLRMRGFERDEIGFIQGLFELMAVAAPPVWGILSDRTGRPRLALALAVMGMVPAFLLFGTVRSLVPAVFVALLFGFFYRPLIPLTDGITLRFIKQHGGDYGKVRIGGSIAFMVAVITLERVGIAQSRSGGIILVAMAVAGLMQFFCISLIPGNHDRGGNGRAEPEHTHLDRAGMRVFLRREFLCFTGAAFLGRVAMMSYYGFFSLYLKEVHGFENAGYIWILGPLSEIPVIYASGRIMDRIGVRNLFALGLFGCALRLFGFSVASAIWMILPLQLLHALTFGAFHCSSVTYVSRIVPQRMQSTAQAVFAAVTVGGGGIIGGSVGGLVARHAGYSVLYGAFGGVALLALLLLLFTVPAVEGHPKDRPNQRV